MFGGPEAWLALELCWTGRMPGIHESQVSYLKIYVISGE